MKSRRLKGKPFLLEKAKKAADFIIHDTSFSGLLIRIIILLLIIRFVIYPLFVWTTGIELLALAVEGYSMEHETHLYCLNESYKDNCTAGYDFLICGKSAGEKKTLPFDKYWALCGDYYCDLNITKDDFGKFPFKDGIHMGDIIILRTIKPDGVAVGDLVRYRQRVTHRVIMKEYNESNHEWYFYFKGDNNAEKDEYIVKEKDLSGKAIIRIPYLGYITLFFSGKLHAYETTWKQ